MSAMRILAFMEAASLTGPAKNLIGFGRWLSTGQGRASGLSLSIATFDRDSRVDHPDGFVSAATQAGIPVHVLKERFRFDVGVLSQLRRLIADVDPHIVQTHNNKSHLLVKTASQTRPRRAWFAFHHGDVYTNLRQRLYNEVDRFSLPHADKVVTVCEAFGPQLIRCGVAPERLRILHNSAVPLPDLAPDERLGLRRSAGVREGAAFIISVGRLSKEKGHADLIRALGQLPHEPRPWNLIVLGTGPEQPALQGLARKLGISDRVSFLGFRRDAARLCQAADLFVLPSHTEGSSNALLEAMCARLPIVATAVGGNPEILEDGRSALLVPARQHAAMAGALGRVLADAGLAAQLGEAAYRRVRDRYSPERYREQLCTYYKEALDGPSAEVRERA